MRLLPLALVLGAASCGPSYVTREQASEIAHDEATSEAVNLSARIDALENKSRDLEAKDQDLESRVAAVDGKAAALGSSISETATALARAGRIADENSVKDMTRRGACGLEYYETANGGTALRNRECKLSDLAPGK